MIANDCKWLFVVQMIAMWSVWSSVSKGASDYAESRPDNAASAGKGQDEKFRSRVAILGERSACCLQLRNEESRKRWVKKDITRHAMARSKPVNRDSSCLSGMSGMSGMHWCFEENYIWNNVAFSNWARNYEYAKTHCAPGMLSWKRLRSSQADRRRQQTVADRTWSRPDWIRGILCFRYPKSSEHVHSKRIDE